MFSKKNYSYLVSEVAQAHEGSINLAHSFIDLVSNTGYDAIKFQVHLAEYETTHNDQFRKSSVNYYSDRFNYWKKMEFSTKQWIELSKFSRKRNLGFICSIFCEESIKILKKLPHLTAIKISSGEMFNYQLISELLKLNKPLIISTGMANFLEVSNLVKKIKKKSKKFHILHCVSQYPCKIKNLKINNISYLKKKLKINNVGYSDHSANKEVLLYAISQEASIIENHVCLNKKIYGPDTTSSLTIEEMEEIVKFRNIYYSLKNQKVSFLLDHSLKINKKLFSKSIALKNDISKGQIINKELLTLKKPGSGINPKFINKFNNKIAKKDLSRNKLLKWSDIK